MNAWFESGLSNTFCNVACTDVVFRSATLDGSLIIGNGGLTAASGIVAPNAAMYVHGNNVGITRVPDPLAALDIGGTLALRSTAIWCDTEGAPSVSNSTRMASTGLAINDGTRDVVMLDRSGLMRSTGSVCAADGLFGVTCALSNLTLLSVDPTGQTLVIAPEMPPGRIEDALRAGSAFISGPQVFDVLSRSFMDDGTVVVTVHSRSGSWDRGPKAATGVTLEVGHDCPSERTRGSTAAQTQTSVQVRPSSTSLGLEVQGGATAVAGLRAFATRFASNVVLLEVEQATTVAAFPVVSLDVPASSPSVLTFVGWDTPDRLPLAAAALLRRLDATATVTVTLVPVQPVPFNPGGPSQPTQPSQPTAGPDPLSLALHVASSSTPDGVHMSFVYAAGQPGAEAAAALASVAPTADGVGRAPSGVLLVCDPSVPFSGAWTLERYDAVGMTLRHLGGRGLSREEATLAGARTLWIRSVEGVPRRVLDPACDVAVPPGAHVSIGTDAGPDALTVMGRGAFNDGVVLSVGEADDGAGARLASLSYAAGVMSIGSLATLDAHALQVDGEVVASGQVTAPSFVSLSDARLKCAVTASDPRTDLEQILALKVRRYAFTRDVVGRTTEEEEGRGVRMRTGVLAQEMRGVMPDAVVSVRDLMAVDGDCVMYKLVSAVQELSRDLMRLRSQNATSVAGSLVRSSTR